MSCKILMSLLIPIILLHKMEIITTTLSARAHNYVLPNNDSTVHFCRDYNSRKNTATDRDLTSERTFLVYSLGTVGGDLGVPMYVPSIASLGVLKPRPMSLYHLFDFDLAAVLGFWKM